jgi:5,10-methylenetetrahydromethanopterin reductase
MKRVAIGFLGDETTEDMLSHVRLAEEVGFESVWMSETRFVRDAFTVLGAFSQVTSRIRLATAVINPYTRNPALAAVSLATLDQLSNGRAIFGVGAGSAEILKRQGIGLHRPIKAVKEMVNIVDRLLAGERVTCQGASSTLSDVRLDVKPVRTKIPVYVGATGPRMLRLAGEVADGVLLNSPTSPEYLERASEMVLGAAKSRGRDLKTVDIAACIECAVSEDSRQAKDLVRPIIATYLAYFPSIAKESNVEESLLQEVRSALLMRGVDAALPLITDEIVSSLAAAGTEDEYLSRLDVYIKAGVSLPVIFPHGSKKQVEHAIRACGRRLGN